MTFPIISVLMPVYNGEKYLKDSIDSILNQTYKNFEFIIIDDGSTDKTEEIIKSYSDKRIRFIKNEKNLGIVKSLNLGIDLARGKYIARMDADDISLPERFEKQVEFMENHPEVNVCGSWIEYFGARSGVWKTLKSDAKIKVGLLFGSQLAHPTILAKKEVFVSYPYREEYKDAEDYHLWVLMSKDYTFSNLQEVLLRYRIHEDQISQKYLANQSKLSIQIQQLYLTSIDSKCKPYKSLEGKISSCKNLFSLASFFICLFKTGYFEYKALFVMFLKKLKGVILFCIK